MLTYLTPLYYYIYFFQRKLCKLRGQQFSFKNHSIFESQKSHFKFYWPTVEGFISVQISSDYLKKKMLINTLFWHPEKVSKLLSLLFNVKQWKIEGRFSCNVKLGIWKVFFTMIWAYPKGLRRIIFFTHWNCKNKGYNPLQLCVCVKNCNEFDRFCVREETFSLFFCFCTQSPWTRLKRSRMSLNFEVDHFSVSREGLENGTAELFSFILKRV